MEDQCYQVHPGAERYEDGIEEAGCEDVAVSVGEGALSRVSEAIDFEYLSLIAYEAFGTIGT